MNDEMIYVVTSVYVDDCDAIDTTIEYGGKEYTFRTDGTVLGKNERVVVAHIVGQVLYALSSSS